MTFDNAGAVTLVMSAPIKTTACLQRLITPTLSTMAKNDDREAKRQRNNRLKNQREFDKLKAFYAYVFIQDPDIIRSFEAKQPDETQNEEIAYINNFDPLSATPKAPNYNCRLTILSQ